MNVAPVYVPSTFNTHLKKERSIINDLIMQFCETTADSINCDLNNKGINTLYKAQFPKGIKILNLNNNKIRSLHDVILPDSLEELYLDGNYIKEALD